MTEKEKQAMMAEIMDVVERHVAESEEKEPPKYSNKYGREYGISDEEMSKWKDEYRKMRVDTKTILEQVRKNPINTSTLISSFDIDLQTSLLK